MGQALRQEAAELKDSLQMPAGERVLGAISRQPTKARRIRIGYYPLAAAACSMIAALLTWAVFSSLPKEPPGTDERPDFSIVNAFLRNDLPPTWASRVEKPLADEVESLSEGTKSAVRFLVACVAINPAREDARVPD